MSESSPSLAPEPATDPLAIVSTLLSAGVATLGRTPRAVLTKLPELGIQLAGGVARVWLRTQQTYDDLVERGEEVTGMHEVDIQDEPAWAHFDEDDL